MKFLLSSLVYPVSSLILLRRDNREQLDYSKVTDVPPCACQAGDPSWKAPAERAAQCFFIDLGAAGGNSYNTFLTTQNFEVANNLSSRDQCHALLVEANPGFSKQLTDLAQKSSVVTPITQTAIYMCDKEKEVFMMDPDVSHDRWGSSLDKNHASVNQGNAQPVDVKLVNLMRLLKTSVLPTDSVTLKMDIEGAEWDILPCLAQNQDIAQLIDVFYMENHCPFGPGGIDPNTKNVGWCPSHGQAGTTQQMMIDSVKKLTSWGVKMPHHFSQTFLQK